MSRPLDLIMLLQMLTYCRPAGSLAGRAFIDRYIRCLPNAERDTWGNWHVIIGGCLSVVWSCHTDTVHTRSGRQTTHLDPLTGMVGLSKRSKQTSSCLGADDTAGVWLCVQMILAGTPGHYIFHAGEEIGGVGSSELATYSPTLLDGCQIAIALDRAGYGDVITHQACSRCCSDTFGAMLADSLNTIGDDHGFSFTPSDRGVFTDTANYIDLVPECTNLSVGYFDQHTRHETLDTVFVRRLRDALLRLDTSTLPIMRDPKDVDYSYSYNYHQQLMLADRPAYDDPNDHYCDYCGLGYRYIDSNAIDWTLYCGYDCEQRDGALSDVAVASVYLDPTHEAVQRHLRRVK